MIDLTKYGYIETETPPIGLIPGRITELQREQYTVITEYGEVSAVLKGSFYHTAQTKEEFPCVGDFVLLQGDPTRHLNALRQVRMVVKNGDVPFPEEIYTAMGIEPFGRKPSLRLPVAQ